ncbi:response regulator transcription factor [Parvibium lacunae]|uniref:DNA-binding response regulator n=1 Tax=Parvibium lacunae TaxID=1888893 RepID=A0A368L399_9BURK|nr:response regulator [Parvibium lacunae]RCS57588.1 DNA-binding response regulator [Parvibium lacunae]
MLYVIDDEDIIRDALILLFKSRGIKAIGFASANAFLDAINEHAIHFDQPACILLDVRMPQMSGLELFDILFERQLHQQAPVIFLTGHGDVPMAVEALKKGAFDFFEKPFNDNKLVDRVLEALNQAQRTTHLSAQKHQVHEDLASLTDREKEVMTLILAGKYNKVIADQLGISMRTVEVHRARIFDKMHVKSAVELAQLLKNLD